ncbi:dipeptidase [Brevibacterium moorei]|uniref:dipeptidase n=1 Tax=Brevibacterium moorei TaxID=2968457 RepID=UPI00211C05DD|nr:dipeptidase [Brevibacterium sp. 68QC2CO]MCQ9384341.1 dipeptidase [Brevibacterium sp. 68QC2CO]
MTHSDFTSPELTADTLHTELGRLMPEVIERWRTLVAIPSIAWPSYPAQEVRRSAEQVADFARRVGFETVEVLTATRPDGTEGYPAVIARKPATAGRPTIVLYGHHDVQPVGDESLWDTPPFELTQRGDRVFGRGASDDKAGVMVHLTALELLGDRLGVGVTMFIEGEEEAGSPSFSDFIHRYRDRLAGDVIVVADSGNWAPGEPALTASLRGMVALEFTVRTLDHAVHSGMYGGLVPDAGLALTRLLASLHTADGSVAVAGLVSNTTGGVEYAEDVLRADSGILPTSEFIGHGPLSSRVWNQPSLTVIGVDLPSVDHSSNTLQPAARAKVSMRLAPGQDPQAALAALKEHLRANVSFGAQVEFGAAEAGSPWSADPHDPVVETAHAALSEGFGHPSVAMGLGGSIPFIADLLEVFPSASILVTGVEDPDSRAHSANESQYLPDLRNAIVSEALLLDKLARG